MSKRREQLKRNATRRHVVSRNRVSGFNLRPGRLAADGRARQMLRCAQHDIPASPRPRVSASFSSAASGSRRERGTVLIMVVAVLAMLFIIGATLLLVSRFERNTANTIAEARNLQNLGNAIIEPVNLQLVKDIKGDDGIPYNASFNPDDGSRAEDFSDMPGFFISPDNVRNGDLMFSTTEPYRYSGQSQWYLYSTSWSLDSDVGAGSTPPGNELPITFAQNRRRDADADGFQDSPDSNLFNQLKGVFGTSMNFELRVLPHGGMVMLDPFTHPSLLSQVIHPRDAYHDAPLNLWSDGLTLEVRRDENNLRRRYMLPPLIEGGTDNLSVDRVEKHLPFTLGYEDPTGDFDDCTPHFWILEDLGNDDPCMGAWWDARFTQPPPLTARNPSGSGGAYKPNEDNYDRRHLLTTANYDDILRPIRDEKRLQRILDVFGPGAGDLFGVINPDHNDPGYPLPTSDSAYGWDGSTAQFNRPNLRTKFSLRDVLEPAPTLVVDGTINIHASYSRAMQLTAYYLAMIQRTTVPGSNKNDPATVTAPEWLEQLKTAMQLAVNTIDFADRDTLPTVLEWTDGTNTIKVAGVERQPYITEAYAKVVIPTDGEASPAWDDSADGIHAESVYALELYNPYSEPLELSRLEIANVVYEADQLDQLSGIEGVLNLAELATDLPTPVTEIPPHGYLVLSNRLDDPTPDAAGFIPPAGSPFIPGAVVPGAGTPVNFVDVSVLPSMAGKIFKFTNARAIELRVSENQAISLQPSGQPTQTGSPAVVIDRMQPIGMGAPDTFWAATETAGRREPDDASDKLVLESSLQRHKEPIGGVPVHWHFTLAGQVLVPVEVDTTDPVVLAAFGQDTADVKDRPPVHNLLGSVTFGALGGPGLSDNQSYVAKFFRGEPIASSPLGFPFSPPLEAPTVAPFPVLTADRGVDALGTGGTLAFPTTGTLALVTRYAHDLEDDKPVSVRALEGVKVNAINPSAQELAHPNGGDPTPQIAQLDNGHMPMFDLAQLAKDRAENESRLDVPWGQLIYEYFTALPLEELVRPIPLSEPDPTQRFRLIDQEPYDAAYASLFPHYPVVEPVEVAGRKTVGPRVRGRININFAPWWVLDGLPMLPDGYGATVDLQAAPTLILETLPVRELEAVLLDPDPGDPNYPDNPPTFADPATRPGERFLDLMVDDWDQGETSSRYQTGLNTPSGFTDMGPHMAKYMVSYREPLVVDGVWTPRDVAGSSPEPLFLPKAGAAHAPGFVTVGEMASMLSYVPVKTEFNGTEFFDPDTVNFPNTSPNIPDLRNLTVNSGTEDTKPFSYLGYLQLVAPMVRLQDWATTRNHVFTIYNTVGSEQVTFRSQVTVDRTRSLHSEDLPVRIAESEPISYFNTLDQ